MRRLVMNKRSAFVVVAAVAVLACSEKKEPPREHVVFGEYIQPEDSFPKLRYFEGQVSLNDRCAVRKVRLNSKMPPVYVNGRAVGFC
jgi:hypothetical protein